MISPEREQELLKIQDVVVLFDLLTKELNIPKGKRLPLGLTTPKLAKHILSLSKDDGFADGIVHDIGLHEYLVKERKERENGLHAGTGKGNVDTRD